MNFRFLSMNTYILCSEQLCRLVNGVVTGSPVVLFADILMEETEKQIIADSDVL